MEGNRNTKSRMLQASLELLLMLSFGLAVLLPVAVFGFVQLAATSASAAAVQAAGAANKLAYTAAVVASQGYRTQTYATIQVPEGVRGIYVGSLNNTVGREIVFVLSTNAGNSSVGVYTLVNVSGNLTSIESPSTYLINVSAQGSCPSNPNLPCVYISPVLST